MMFILELMVETMNLSGIQSISFELRPSRAMINIAWLSYMAWQSIPLPWFEENKIQAQPPPPQPLSGFF